MGHDRDHEQTPERKHSILKHLGLAGEQSDPDQWIRLGSCRIDGPEVTSAAAAALVEQLAQIGITAHSAPYKLPDHTGFNAMDGGPDVADRIRIAVLVQRRDSEQAKQFLLAHQRSENRFQFSSGEQPRSEHAQPPSSREQSRQVHLPPADDG